MIEIWVRDWFIEPTIASTDNDNDERQYVYEQLFAQMMGWA